MGELTLKVRDIAWIGVRTSNYEKMVDFYKQVMGLSVTGEGANFTWFKLPNGHQVDVYSQSDVDHEFFTAGPVVGFLVDDVDSARREMEAAGIEFIGPIQRSEHSSWNHFRGPDGNIYEIISENPDST